MADPRVPQQTSGLNPMLEEKLTEILLATDTANSGLNRVQINRTAEDLDLMLDHLDGILDLAAEDLPVGRSARAIFGAIRILGDARKLAQSIASASMPKSRA